MSDLRERQELREIQALHDGVATYKRKFEEDARSGARGVGEQSAGMGLVFVAMKAMIPWIEEHVGYLEDGKAHPSQVPGAIHWLTEFNPDAVAYITAKLCVSAAYVDAKVTRTAMKIANLIEENYRYEQLEAEEPKLAHTMSRKAARWSRARTRRKIIRKAADVAGIKRMGWTEQEKLRLGAKLIEVFVVTTGFAELNMVTDSVGKATTQRVLHMTDDARERLMERRDDLALDEPDNKPMIYPPKPWTDPITGGYLTERLKTPILRGTAFRRVTEGLLDELFSTDLSQVYAAVNKVQSTAWRINRPVFELMDECHRAGYTYGDLPQAEDAVLPPVPSIVPPYEDEQVLTEAEAAALARWKQDARAVHEDNARQRSWRASLFTKMRYAREVVNEEAIYFPHSLDFRGRIYPMAAELTPQGDDFAKAVLEFAEGKRLGESGAYWLHVHIANLFGIDKVSFADRIEWVRKHETQLLDSALNPLDGQRFWEEADYPWSALAACFEYAGYKVMGTDYVSHLPIAMDGSCSGIQHFSAMLRDQRGAEAVNLVNNEQPADIYTEVLDVVRAKLSESKEPLAKIWKDKVDRKIVKRPCMTFAYSVTSAGIKNQILDEMRKRKGTDFLPGTSNWEAANFLAPIVEESIREVVDRAAEAMDWLKGVSKVVSKQEIPTGWTTPLGFRVLQPYLKSVGKKLEVMFDGVRLTLTLSIESHKIDRAKQASAVAPNYVHSMDATHLMMTALRMDGVTDSFAVIHDSFGVHACDVDELHYALRDEFIKLYSDQEVLVEFYRESLMRLPGSEWPNVPSPPEAGDYNIEEVRDADFFFA